MNKAFLFVLIGAVVVLAGLGSFGLDTASAQSRVTQVPGNTVVIDDVGDLILVNADPLKPGKPCSLPPGAPLKSPPWTDIKKAKITQLGGGLVELSMVLKKPVPDTPPFPFVSYNFQFEGGCLPGPWVTDKGWISVRWRDGHWEAFWGVITSCDPRQAERGDDVDFRIAGATVRVRVQLDDLMLTVPPGVELPWYATVRRMPFKHEIFTHTTPVDVAPNVVAFDPGPPPSWSHPEEPAIWAPRAKGK